LTLMPDARRYTIGGNDDPPQGVEGPMQRIEC
jgi:hypothetical protein